MTLALTQTQANALHTAWIFMCVAAYWLLPDFIPNLTAVQADHLQKVLGIGLLMAQGGGSAAIGAIQQGTPVVQK